MSGARGNPSTCGKCYYGTNWGVGWYCDYLGIVGHMRPCKFDACDIYLNKGQGRKHRLHKELMELYKQCLNDREISEALGIGENAVRSWRSSHCLPANGGSAKKIDESKAMELYGLGKSDREIAVELGCFPNTVSKWRRKQGLTANGLEKEEA